LVGLNFDPEDGGNTFLRNVEHIHVITSQEIIFRLMKIPASLFAVPNSTAALTSHVLKAQHLYCKVERKDGHEL
jgi:hypothetical protein